MNKHSQLEIALEKAYGWQQKIMDSAKKINGHTYFDPHKWIICLLGSDMFMVTNFMQ